LSTIWHETRIKWTMNGAEKWQRLKSILESVDWKQQSQ
jgi:hypothetical protein